MAALVEKTVVQVAATGVPYEIYMEQYAADFYEWVGGSVIKMSPIHERHDKISRYLAGLFDSYFELEPTGCIRQAPFVMKLPALEIAREPDVQVILNANPGNLTDTAMIGPADLCIEVVSAESVERDHGEKFAEYERGGVCEYWIVDPLRDECRFYRLDEEGRYRRHAEDADGHYRTPVLPGLTLHVPTLWQPTLPGPGATFQAVQATLGERE